MKLIGLKKEGKLVSVQFYGCQLRCPYCTHIRQPKTEKEIQEVLEFIADPKVEEVYLGGAEPTVQKKALLELLQRLGRMNKRVTLKTNGMDPGFLEETLGLVNRYVVEIKCPLDDRECNAQLVGLGKEATRKYLESLAKSLDVIRGREVRIWIRVIPGFMDHERMARIGRQVSGIATEAYLMQFLSMPENEAPFAKAKEPGPNESEMVALARVLLEHVPNVYVRGKDFRADFRSANRT
ncbi:MAG: radical SAM protein [Methanomassiliicoccales archaeon]|nr:radical SAM protein [Methanomassiliicoccales archaeon]